MNRRKFITTTGAAVMAALSSLSLVGWAWGTSAEIKKCGIIMVVDETIPYLSVYEQFEILRAHNTRVGVPLGDDCCFGLYTAGDGTKEFTKSCAKTCDGWIAGMRRHGFEKVAVMVWSRRYGPMLTIPLKTRGDIMVVRAYGPSTATRPPLSSMASIDPIRGIGRAPNPSHIKPHSRPDAYQRSATVGRAGWLCWFVIDV